MFLNFNIYNSIILAGVIQGLIFGAVVLFSKKYRHKSVYFLMTLIAVYSLGNLQWYLEDIKLITLGQLFKHYYIPIANLTPILLYFYVTSYLYPDRKIKKKEKLLIIPFLISFGLSLLYKLLITQNDTIFTERLLLYLSTYDELISAIFNVAIMLVLFRVIHTYETQNKVVFNQKVALHLKWLKVTLYFMFTFVILWIVLNILYSIYPGKISFYPIWIAIAVTIYWLGHVGIYKYGIVEQQKSIRKKRNTKHSVIEKSKTKHIIIERLKHFLEDEKRFLDASLTLEKTAEVLELSQGHLSKIINTELKMNFKEYLNTLRVEEAKGYLKDSEFSNYTLVAIGLEAGFNSKSAFNTSFKKITGITPSEFKKTSH